MNKVKEFQEIMAINDLNKNLEDDNKGSKKGSAEGDTESMGDHTDSDDAPEGDELRKTIHSMIKKNSHE
jgi:hypothetical protein